MSSRVVISAGFAPLNTLPSGTDSLKCTPIKAIWFTRAAAGVLFSWFPCRLSRFEPIRPF